MEINPILRQVLMDKHSLQEYQKNESVNWGSIEQRIFLNERKMNFHIPDNFYRSAADLTIKEKGIDSLSKLMSKGLMELASGYLERRGNKLYVIKESYHSWQDLLTLCPPLILTAAMLAKDVPLANWNKGTIMAYMEHHINPNAQYTALHAPYIAFLKDLKIKEGFSDLHIHLNGSMETDAVWQDWMKSPEATCADLEKELQNPLVAEQLEQEGVFKTGIQLHQLLRTARALRYYIVNTHLINLENRSFSMTQVDELNQYISRDKHPLWEALFPNSTHQESDMAVECLMYVMLIEKLKSEKHDQKPALATAFHHYLLIQASVNKLLVQQVHQNGFRQFQKITVNELRNQSEKAYKKRFSQMNGNGSVRKYIHIVEGRFSPKKTPRENKVLIDNILKGWEDFKVGIIAKKEVTRTWNVYQDSVKIAPDVLPYLCLIAHFIKKTDKLAKDPHLFLVRHERLRKDLWQQANALSCLLHDELLPHHHIRGIDAASSEFDASPEVFAPIYRYMRHEGVLNATFHAGEDFNHIVSGIRAIYEAVHFLGLQSGNRIGHAVALGICPSLWRQTMGKHIYIRQGEWLDNLIFVRHYILTHCENDVRVIGLLPRIESEIHRHANQIYREYQSKTDYEVCIFSLTEAWLNRKWCPMLWNCANYVEAQQIQTFDIHEWGSILEEKERATKKIRKLMDDYHEPKYKKAYDKIIKIDTCKDDFFSVTDIESLQDFMLEELAKKEIVLETLPTSNVRIGIYSNFAQHHLKRWLGLQAKHQCKHYPKVVVGSDDTGIFATNIYNEYAHIYLNMACTDADTHIRNLQYNSNVYNFHLKRDLDSSER